MSTMRALCLLGFLLAAVALSGCFHQSEPDPGTQSASSQRTTEDRLAQYDRQMARMDEQQAVADAQQKRMEALLTRWERQADRSDALLDRQEQAAGF